MGKRPICQNHRRPFGGPKNHPKTVWIPHRDGWEDKVREIVNREATKEDVEELNKFMQKIKGKN